MYQILRLTQEGQCVLTNTPIAVLVDVRRFVADFLELFFAFLDVFLQVLLHILQVLQLLSQRDECFPLQQSAMNTLEWLLRLTC